MKKMNKKGFTLIEMLVVIAIIAILVAIIIPTVSNATTKAKEATDVANIRAHVAEYQIAVASGDTTAATTAKAALDGYVKKSTGATYTPGNASVIYVATVLDGGTGNGNHTYEWALTVDTPAST